MANRMRVAVTGSSGLIGRALVDRLEAGGHRVVRVVRPGGSGRPAPSERPSGLTADADATAEPLSEAAARAGRERGEQEREPQHRTARRSKAIRAPSASVAWDPTVSRIDAAGIEGLDAVVHLAGEPIAARRWSPDQKERIARSRVQGTAVLAQALARLDAPPDVLVSASAIGYYGDRGDEPLDESSSGGDDFLARVCCDWESAADPARAAGIRVAHPRTGVVLSRSGGALAEMLPFFRLGIGGRIGSGRQWVSWISLHDEVEALVWLLEADVEGPVNLTAPEPVTNRELTAALARALRRPALLPTPKPALWAKLGRELTEALLYSSARVAPAVLQRGGFTFAHPDIATGLAAVLAR